MEQLGVDGPPRKLTASPAGAGTPAWSPDDRWIAYRRARADGADLVVIPPLGAPERTLADLSGTEPGLSWTPDGKWIAVAQNESLATSSLFAIALETGERRRLTTFTTKGAGSLIRLGDNWPSFSRDGSSLAFARQVNGWVYEICIQPLTRDLRPDGEPRTVARPVHGFVFGIVWTADGRELIYSAGPASSLWRVAASGRRPPRRLAYSGAARYPAISRTPPRLAYGWSVVNENLWRLNLRKAERMLLSASSVHDYNQHPQYSPDGRKIAFQSERSGDREVWTCDSDGANCLQLTKFAGPLCGTPRWSPDSRWIALDSRQPGNSEIYVIAAEGGSPRRLTNDPNNNLIPAWSHDGRWIYFASDRSGRYEVWKASREGGETTQVTRSGGFAAFESPDGKYLYYTKFNPQGAPQPLFRMPAEGGDEVQVLPGVSYFANFSVTPKGVYFAPPAENAIRFLDAVSGKLSTLATLDKAVGEGLAVSPDDAYVVWAQIDRATQNLMLVDGFR